MPSRSVRTVDYHTAGEPFRIVVEGCPPIEGDRVLDRRQSAIHGPADALRRLLCNEPRGHADMYGCFLVPPNDEGALLGTLFWHKDGFSTACGHGTIALAVHAVDSGMVDAPDDGELAVAIDVPSGRVSATVHRRGGRTTSVAFTNVPGFVIERGVEVPTSAGMVPVDVGYGGAIYATARAGDVGASVSPADVNRLIAISREIKSALAGTTAARHRSDERLSGVYGVIWYDDLGDLPDGPHQRNCTVFADGEVDRSPCGSGTSTRLVLLHDEGRIRPGQVLRHDSVVGSTFLGRVLGVGPHGVITQVEGMAYRTGEHHFVLDPADPLGDGFQLR